MADEERIRLLEAQVSLLEKHINFLLKVHGLDTSIFRHADDEILLELYRDAVMLLGYDPEDIDEEIIRRWADTFLQLSEYEFTRLQPLVNYDHTWEPFYQLCIRMMTVVRHHKDIGTDIGLQQLYALLDKDRQNLRDAGIMMIKMCGNKLPTNIKVLLRGNEIMDLLPQ
jgi:hypothetical protein